MKETELKPKTKKCAECGKVKHTSEFHKCKKNRDGYFVWCKDCKRQYRIGHSKKPKINESWKVCSSCKKFAHISKFYKNPDTKDGYSGNCKECKKKEMKERYSKPEYKITHKEWERKYRKTEKGKLAVKKRYPKAQAEGYFKEYSKKPNVRKYNADWHINKIRTDKTYRLNNLMSKRINLELRGTKSHRHWEDLVGYTVEDLKVHLESKFKDGMNWDNIGQWHIDHIIPVSLWKFESFNDSEFKQCWALSNLQPLWAFDNQSKSNKIK